jgi:hypothetical protein
MPIHLLEGCLSLSYVIGRISAVTSHAGNGIIQAFLCGHGIVERFVNTHENSQQR